MCNCRLRDTYLLTRAGDKVPRPNLRAINSARFLPESPPAMIIRNGRVISRLLNPAGGRVNIQVSRRDLPSYPEHLPSYPDLRDLRVLMFKKFLCVLLLRIALPRVQLLKYES